MRQSLMPLRLGLDQKTPLRPIDSRHNQVAQTQAHKHKIDHFHADQ